MKDFKLRYLIKKYDEPHFKWFTFWRWKQNYYTLEYCERDKASNTWGEWTPVERVEEVAHT